MAHYRIPKHISSELKINKALYLTDLGLLVGLLLFTFVMSNIVHSSLTFLFYGFMAVVAGLMIIRPATNPKKRIYEAIYYAIRRRKDTYTAIDYIVDDTDEYPEDGEKNNGDLQ
jgi:ABC-type iron transport system FetAB permease component